MTFKEFLLQEKHQLTHLEHLEDLIWIDGIKGGKDTIKYLENIVNSLGVESAPLTVKIDGAPSLIAGWSPEDGRFFVGTKSFFNKTPKINYTQEDIDLNHGHAPGLSKKLKEALQYLPKVIKKGNILQGDFIFSKEDLKFTSINNEKGVMFTPNTITYFVSASSRLFDKIKKAKIGIVWHTSYSGSTLDSLSGSFKISRNQYNLIPDVYSRNVNVDTQTIGWSKAERTALKKEILSLKKDLNQMNFKEIDDIASDKKLSMTIRTYINSKVRNNIPPSKNEIGQLMDYVIARFEKEKFKLKSEKGKLNKEQQKQEFISTIRSYARTIYYVFDWFYEIKQIKNTIIKKMEEIQTDETGYLQQPDGSFVMTAPEGFVLSKDAENGIKFVNRAVFSAANFNNVKFS